MRGVASVTARETLHDASLLHRLPSSPDHAVPDGWPGRHYAGMATFHGWPDVARCDLREHAQERWQMYKALSVGLLAVSLTVSFGAHAQTPRAQSVSPAAAPSPVTVRQSATGFEFTISPGELLAIGSGSAIGIVLTSLLLPTNLAYAYGGLAGAYIGYIWYAQGYTLYQLYQSKS